MKNERNKFYKEHADFINARIDSGIKYKEHHKGPRNALPIIDSTFNNAFMPRLATIINGEGWELICARLEAHFNKVGTNYVFVVSQVFAYGFKKYSNFGGFLYHQTKQDHVAALVRHIVNAGAHDCLDTESGFSHLELAYANLIIIKEFERLDRRAKLIAEGQDV